MQPSDPSAAPFAATAYGAHLRLVLDAALAWRADLFTPDEAALVAAFAGLSDEAADVVARLLPRKRLPVVEDQLGVSAGALDAACADGWLARGAAAPQESFLVAPMAIAPTAAAIALYRAALVVAFADDAEDASALVRVAMGALAPPPGTPLARALAGEAPPRATLRPFADRAALDAYLIARATRAAGPVAGAYEAALAAVIAAEGQALPLPGWQLTATHHWAHLLWDCCERLRDDDARVERGLRALRRAPIAPGLARRVWTRVQRRERRPLRARRLAAELARWSLWPAGERARWRLRGEGRRERAGAETWTTLRMPAWLARDGASVLAQGENVEDHALARLARDGWRGVHAEGGFWLALAALLFRRELAELPDCAAPLQMAPLDWGRHGFAARRAPALARRAAAIVRDPAAALAESLGDQAWLPGLVAPPPLDAARAVCAAFPRAALAELLLAVLRAPSEAAGLPDLVLWRDDGRLALYEVKSPNDRLSDAQRAWLAWLVERGVEAGVVRVDERAPRQGRWLAASPTPAAEPSRAPRSPRVRARRQGDDAPLVLDRGAVRPYGETGDAVVPIFGGEPCLAASRWRGRVGDDAVDGWARPVETVLALRVGGVLGRVGDGRATRQRRWYTLPPGWAIAALVSFEALPDGGLAPCATVLMRPSGWLLPRACAALEPVVAPLVDVLGAAAGRTVDWSHPPDAEPWRPEATAAAWGLDRDLADQLALVGATPFRLRLDRAARRIHLDLPADAPCLWAASDERLVRGVLAEVSESATGGVSGSPGTDV